MKDIIILNYIKIFQNEKELKRYRLNFIFLIKK